MALDKEKLAETMGESEHMRPTNTIVPMITLEGNKGVYMRRELGEEGYEKPKEIGQTFSGIIVAVRMALSSYEPKSIKSTPEYSSSTDKVALFERKGKDAKSERIDEGYIMTLKGNHPELREQRWVYVLVNGRIEKLKIKGAGLGHWFKFLKDLQKKDLHTFDVLVKFDPAFEKNEDLGKEYYAPSLSIERELSEDEIEHQVGPVIEKLSQEFKSIAQYRAKKSADQEDDAPALDDVPVINLDEEEPAAEDMPF